VLLNDTLYLAGGILSLSILLTCCINWLLYLLSCTKTGCVFEAVSKCLDLCYCQTAYTAQFSSRTSSLTLWFQLCLAPCAVLVPLPYSRAGYFCHHCPTVLVYQKSEHCSIFICQPYYELARFHSVGPPSHCALQNAHSLLFAAISNITLALAVGSRNWMRSPCNFWEDSLDAIVGVPYVAGSCLIYINQCKP